jgi:hypothetical protein
MKRVNIHALRVAAISGLLIYIDGDRYTYSALAQLNGMRFYEVIEQNIREWRVKSLPYEND